MHRTRCRSQLTARPCRAIVHQNPRTNHIRSPRTERLVSLYFTLMSAAVRRMASMASSSVTLYTPSAAIESCAAVTAFTAAQMDQHASQTANHGPSSHLPGCCAPGTPTQLSARISAVAGNRTEAHDARDLHEAVDGVARQAQVMFFARFREGPDMEEGPEDAPIPISAACRTVSGDAMHRRSQRPRSRGTSEEGSYRPCTLQSLHSP